MTAIFLQTKRIGREQYAQVGNKKFFETEYLLEKVTENSANALSIRNQRLLPLHVDEYITLSDASLRSGLAVKSLRDLCNNGYILAIKNGKNWRINRKSLEQYLNK